jgi:transcriptional regulator with XRE-family HTH domain
MYLMSYAPGPPEKGKKVIMPTNVDDKIGKLSPTQRKKVEVRAAQLVAEEMTLRELRHARKLTQVRMAKALGITQDSVSRLEMRSDLLLSTLRKTVEAMGGNLSLIAEFPDRGPVVLAGVAVDDGGAKAVRRKPQVATEVAKAGRPVRRRNWRAGSKPAGPFHTSDNRYYVALWGNNLLGSPSACGRCRTW